MGKVGLWWAWWKSLISGGGLAGGQVARVVQLRVKMSPNLFVPAQFSKHSAQYFQAHCAELRWTVALKYRHQLSHQDRGGGD